MEHKSHENVIVKVCPKCCGAGVKALTDPIIPCGFCEGRGKITIQKCEDEQDG